MLNGGLQILQSGVVPGNKNADNVDLALRQFEHLIYPSEAIATAGVKAIMLTSFGFGQKGGLVVGLAPRYVFAALDRPRYEAYRVKCAIRVATTNRAFIEGLSTNSLFKAKTTSAWLPEDEARVFLDPFARVSRIGDGYAFDANNLHSSDSGSASDSSSGRWTAVTTPSTPSIEGLVDGCQKWVEQAVLTEGASHVGVDVESLTAINISNDVFLERNYTDSEQQYCRSAPDPRQSFAGRWAAKEAVFKSLQLPSKGAGAPLKDIEILSSGGIPTVHVSYCLGFHCFLVFWADRSGAASWRRASVGGGEGNAWGPIDHQPYGRNGHRSCRGKCGGSPFNRGIVVMAVCSFEKQDQVDASMGKARYPRGTFVHPNCLCFYQYSKSLID